MGLVACPDCGRQISDAAPSCIGCGRPMRPAPPPLPARARATPPPTPERVLFQDAAVTVTTARIVVGQDVTYPVVNVTSVREFVEPRPFVLLVVGGAIVFMGTSCAVTRPDAATAGWLIAAIGLALCVGFFAIKPKHWVRIDTAGAESNAISSTDGAWTQRVVAAINEAIVARG